MDIDDVSEGKLTKDDLLLIWTILNVYNSPRTETTIKMRQLSEKIERILNTTWNKHEQYIC